MTIHNILTHASLTLIVAALAIPLHVSASEPDGLASQFQASAAEAAASFRKELKVNLAKSTRPSIRLDSSVVVATKQPEDFDWKEQQTSLVQTDGAE